MFNVLSEYYDALVKNDEARDLWKDFVDEHGQSGSLLEIGSGTGELTLALANDYQVTATDLSESMLQQLKDKDINQCINHYQVLDMCKLNAQEEYDNIIAFCDTINYLLNKEDLKLSLTNFYQALKPEGVLMFDIHSLDRLKEFEDDYIETGNLDGVDYQWTISSEAPYLSQHFVFYEDDQMKQDSFDQFVFDPQEVKTMLETIGFEVSVYTDFITPGIVPGEKIFFVGRKS